MPRIKKAGPWNPQKAEAYVGKGVLKYGDTIPAIRGHITPVPNGPLVKKNGSTLKKGGTVKKVKKGFLGLIAAAPMAAAASMKAKSATKKLQKEAPKIMQAMGGMPPVGMKKGGKIKKADNGIKSKIFVRDRSFGKPIIKESKDGNRKVVHQFKKNPFTGETRMVDKDITRSSEAGPRKVFKRTTTFDPKQNFKSTESSVWRERGKVVKRETLKKGGKVSKMKSTKVSRKKK
jgi:hypothetical protein